MKPGSKLNNQVFDFQDLMINRIHNILLVSSPYDAFILEEDGRAPAKYIAEQVSINEVTVSKRLSKIIDGPGY